MSGRVSDRAVRARLMLLFAPPLIILAPLLEAFGNLSIPLNSPGTLQVFGGLGALGLVLGGTGALMRPGPDSGFLRQGAFVLVLVVVVLVGLDVSFGGHGLLAAAPGGRAGRLVTAAIAAAGLHVVLWLVRHRAASIVFIAALALFTSSAVLNARVLTGHAGAESQMSNTAAAADLPPLLYLVLDGAMGIEGLKRAPGTADFASELRGQLSRHGFRLYGSAFSRHFVSGRSIPNTLNFDFRDDSWGPLLRHHDDGRIRSRLFERLSQDGYEIITYGTEHLDFCFEQATRCETLPSFNPFSPYIPPGETQSYWLHQVIGHAFRESYVMYRYTSWLRSLHTDAPSVFAALDGYAFPRWFDRFDADVAMAPRGRAYFAHFLMPHAPYVLDQSCQLTGASVVGYFLQEEHKLAGTALDEARARAYGAYEAQYRCLLRMLDGFLARLAELPEFDDATIVIHGDHGPRISAGQFAETVSTRDLIDNHSTLYAIRGPGIAAGYDPRLTSVQRLTAEYFAEEALGPDYVTVVLDSADKGQVVVRPMPPLDDSK